MALRIVGVDSPGGGVENQTNPQLNPIGLPDTTTASLQQAAKTQDRTFDTLQRSLEVEKRSAEQQSRSRDYSRGGVGNTIADLMSSATGILNNIAKVEQSKQLQQAKYDEQQAQLNEAAKDERQSVNAANAQAELRQLTANLTDFIAEKGQTEGLAYYEKQLQDFFIRNNDITPEKREALYAVGYAPFQSIKNKFFNEKREEVKKIEGNKADVVKELAQRKAAATIIQAKYDRNDPTAITQAYNELLTTIGIESKNAGLGEMETLRIQTEILREINEQEGLTFEERAQTQDYVDRWREQYEFAITMNNTAMDPNQRRLNMEANAKRLGITSSDVMPYTPQELMQQDLDALHLQAGTRKAVEEQRISEIDAAGINNISVAQKALHAHQTGEPIDTSTMEGKRAEGYRKALSSLADDMRKVNRRLLGRQTELRSVSGSIQAIKEFRVLSKSDRERLARLGMAPRVQNLSRLLEQQAGLQTENDND